MQQKYAIQMINDLNLIDEGLSRSLLDENGFLHRQQERMLFLGNTTTNSGNFNGNTAAAKENNLQVESSSGEVSSDSELLSLFHRSFRNLLTALQKNIDFDQILKWARSVMQKCVILVSVSQIQLVSAWVLECHVKVQRFLQHTPSSFSVSLAVSLIAL